jgi:hypothetical protein
MKWRHFRPDSDDFKWRQLHSSHTPHVLHTPVGDAAVRAG